MPLPKPNPGENQEAFISRCMETSEMTAEFPEEEQRFAVCSSLFESTGDKKKGEMARDGEKDRPSAAKRGYGRKWREKSADYLKRHPHCAECLKNGKKVDASLVDHITPHGGNDDLFWDEDNWQSLCQTCHNRKTVGEKNQKEKDAVDERDDKVTMVSRFDEVLRAPDWMARPFKRTADGFLKGRAVVTNVGIFSYANGDGTIRRELRLPEDVFDPESVASLKLIPVTNGHPSMSPLVDSENAKSLQVGSTGGNPSRDLMSEMDRGFGFLYDEDGRDGSMPDSDRYHLSVDMVITDGETIADVLAGKRALSCGYTAEVEESSGIWMGQPYDAIQRNIRYNHVAVVDQARAGDAARIELRTDSADAVCIGRLNSISEEEDMKKIVLDGVEYQAEAKVVETLVASQKETEGLKARVDELEENAKGLSEKEAALDTANDRIKALEEEVATLKEASLDEAKIDELVEARLELLRSAEDAGVEVTDEMDEATIKRAVILSVFPTADKEKLEKADAVYLDARFDAAVEVMDSNEETAERNAGKVSRKSKEDGKSGGDQDEPGDSEKAREKMVDGLTSEWKNYGKGRAS